ncbi:MAG: chloramphenicol phosphotransferase CPT family protein [Psychrosphaera sp.]|nr:chloramphenicol phosphotransferase CPT family protein [Psychrosphaera sp.]
MAAFGKIIILNGTSSAGKSTLAKALQAQMKDVYLHCTSDAFWDMTPRDIKANSINFPRMKLAMAKSVRALAETGHNVIVDIVFNGSKSYLEMSGELKGLTVVMVKVQCDKEELQKRELARGDRKQGLAESQLDTVHVDVPYDEEVDTSKYSPFECAKQVMAHCI